MLAPFLSASYVERGFKARLLAFQRYSFWSVKVAGLKFIGNVAYNYTGPGLRTQRPRLLNFTAADFQAKQITPVVLLLSDVEISKNIFQNTDCMMHLTKLALSPP